METNEGYGVMNADITSDLIQAGPYNTVSVQLVVDTADADGYAYIQGSNDAEHWSTLAFRDENDAIVDGYRIMSDAQNHIFDATGVGVGWLRLFYDRTSGTGGLTWNVHRKK
jgi:hypothetical protein